MNDPAEVIIDFRKSGWLIGCHLSNDSILLLKNAEAIIDLNIMEDPTYKLPIDTI